jgi:hypothetical protein
MAIISIRQQIKNRLVEMLNGLTINNKNINVFLRQKRVSTCKNHY